MNSEQVSPFDPFAWLEQRFELIETDTTAFIYDHMESQSGKCLLEIYQIFDPANRSHYSDRGATWDFVMSTGGGRTLDFGPGDGWPSLVAAPFIEEVVGVDGSKKRVEVCRDNAGRMGIRNATFVHVPPGTPLPFDDASFDSVMAASSIENSPNPRETLAELHRILKPGGKLRMHYEALRQYQEGCEHDLWLCRNDNGPQNLVIMERIINEERVRQVRLTLDMTAGGVEQVFKQHGAELEYSGLTQAVLEALQEKVTEAAVCLTTHPSGLTWARSMTDLEFSSILPSHGGNAVGRLMFDRLPESERPQKLAELDRMLRPLIAVTAELRAPIENDPWITAVK